jgi:hypothetical protein
MRIELNITRDTAAEFINWLANDGYWGHTDTEFERTHGVEIDTFVINGHELSSYSNQMHQIVIDHSYCHAGGVGSVTYAGRVYKPLDYCLKRLGY